MSTLHTVNKSAFERNSLDSCLSVMRTLHLELGDPKYRPSPLLIRMVDAGRIGRKSGRGFYTYPEA